MICYFDSSALVKLYVEEEGSNLLKQFLQDNPLLATSKVAYAEVRAALARAWREEILGETEYQEAVSMFKEDWPHMVALEISNDVLQKVDLLLDRYRLRGFDALHLASALVLLRSNPEEDVHAVCWDARLWDCFRREGFLLLPQNRPGFQF